MERIEDEYHSSSSVVLCGNISDYYETGTCLITWVLLPFICILGFILNVMAIFVFSIAIYRGQRTSMTVYLIALSAFDSIQLLLSIFIITFSGSYFLKQPPDTGPLIVDKETYDLINMIRAVVTVYFYPVLMTANYGSVWVITLICVQRYFAICFPLSSLRTVELKRATMEVIIISTAACALNLCRFWEFSLDYSNKDPITNQSYPEIGTGPFRNRADHPYYLMAMDGVLYIVLLYFIPFMIVSILNVKIVMVIYTARRTMKSSRSSGGGAGVNLHNSHHRSEHRSALMVLAIILLFFICYTLAVAERLWSIIDTRGAVSKFGGFLNAVSNFMVNLNSTIDPLIYFLFSRGFKDVCMKMRKRQYSELPTTGFTSRNPSLMHSRRSQYKGGVPNGKPRRTEALNSSFYAGHRPTRTVSQISASVEHSKSSFGGGGLHPSSMNTSPNHSSKLIPKSESNRCEQEISPKSRHASTNSLSPQSSSLSLFGQPNEETSFRKPSSLRKEEKAEAEKTQGTDPTENKTDEDLDWSQTENQPKCQNDTVGDDNEESMNIPKIQ